MALAAYHSAAFNKASGLSVAAGAQVEVRKESDGTLAALKSNRAGTLSLSNPMTADASGRFSFYVAADSEGLQIKVTDSDGNTLTLNNVAIGLLAEKDTLNILQDADGDTYWEMEESADEDIARLYIAGTQKVRVDATGMVIGGNDVAGDGPLHIGAGLAGSVTAAASADDLIIEGAGNTGTTWLAPSGNNINLYFGHEGDNAAAFLQWSNQFDTFVLQSGSSLLFRTTNSEFAVNFSKGNIDFYVNGDTNDNVFRVDASQDAAVMGASSPDASALLDMVSTTKGLGLPTWTTTQRNAISTPRDGLIGHNSTLNTVDARLNSAWKSLGDAQSQFSAKGWVNFNGEGTLSVRDSFNVTSVTDNGTGLYTINWDTDFANANYALAAIGIHDNAVDALMVYREEDSAMAVGSAQITTINTSLTRVDAAEVHVVAFGDQ